MTGRTYISDNGTNSGMARGLSPVVGVVVLVALAVLLSASIGVMAPTLGSEPPPSATLTTTVDADTGRIAITHRGGETLTVSELEVLVEIDGNELHHQPPVPFFSARGFVSGPTGPFNSASDDAWRAGETAAVRIAGTNEPGLSRDVSVTVRLVIEGAVVYEETVSAD